MKTNINQITNRAKDEINKCLEGKSIFEMTVWIRDHAQFLEWFCHYNEAKIEVIMQTCMSLLSSSTRTIAITSKQSRTFVHSVLNVS